MKQIFTHRISKKTVGDKKKSSSQKYTRPSSSQNQIQQPHSSIGNQAVQKLFEQGSIQAKLKIGSPNDKYEQEADRVAEQVMNMPEQAVVQQKAEKNELIQSKPIANTITALIQRQQDEEEEEELQPGYDQEPEEALPILESVPTGDADELDEEKEEFIQPKRNTGTAQQVTPRIAHAIHSIKGSGQPLPKYERAFFEPRFGRDFSNVRMHNDTRAARIARSINARAFTLGRDIVFGAGQYSPTSLSGRLLLAHELTHVVQQNGRQLRRAPSLETGEALQGASSLGPNAKMKGRAEAPVKSRTESMKPVSISRVTVLPGSKSIQRQANVILRPRPGPRQPRRITLAGNVPAAGARGRQSPMARTRAFAIAYWQDMGAINNFVNYFRRTLGVAINLVPNIAGMFQTLRNNFQRVTRPRPGMTPPQIAALRTRAQILRLVVVAHRGAQPGSIGSGQTDITPAQIMNQPDAHYVRTNVLAPRAGVELWACNIQRVRRHLRPWARVFGRSTRAVRGGLFRTRRIRPYLRRAILNHPNNVIRSREFAANLLHGGVQVRHTRDVFNNPNLYLPRYRIIQSREERQFRSWLVRVYRHLEGVGAINGPTRTRGRRVIRVRLSNRERIRAVSIIFNRSRGEIRYAGVSHRRRFITPASGRRWRRIWIVRPP